MNKQGVRLIASTRLVLILGASMVLAAGQVGAQVACIPLTSGLQLPVALIQSNQGNLLVAEGGTPTPNTGRISIVEPSGQRRTLLAGLPSGLADVGDPNGPAGLYLRGRTLYAAIGVGDVGVIGRNAQGQPIPGTAVPNPNGPSSPIMSSVLAIHFSAQAEKITAGFTLSPADHQTLASGRKLTLSNGGGDRVEIELVADLPNYVANPLPQLAANVQLSNPFGIVAVANRLYVTDGGRNRVWEIDIPTGSVAELAAFPSVPNPLFPTVGPPMSDAVPTGIAHSDGQLLVTLFRGAPFAPGTSTVQQIDVPTGNQAPFISGLKTAIDVLPLRQRNETDYLVLQHSSGPAPFFGGPGLVLRFDEPGGSPVVITDCLNRPTAMVLDDRARTLFVTELTTGRVVAVRPAP
jgi:hypothetical protein